MFGSGAATGMAITMTPKRLTQQVLHQAPTVWFVVAAGATSKGTVVCRHAKRKNPTGELVISVSGWYWKPDNSNSADETPYIIINLWLILKNVPFVLNKLRLQQSNAVIAGSGLTIYQSCPEKHLMACRIREICSKGILKEAHTPFNINPVIHIIQIHHRGGLIRIDHTSVQSRPTSHLQVLRKTTCRIINHRLPASNLRVKLSATGMRLLRK